MPKYSFQATAEAIDIARILTEVGESNLVEVTMPDGARLMFIRERTFDRANDACCMPEAIQRVTHRDIANYWPTYAIETDTKMVNAVPASKANAVWGWYIAKDPTELVDENKLRPITLQEYAAGIVAARAEHAKKLKVLVKHTKVEI